MCPTTATTRLVHLHYECFIQILCCEAFTIFINSRHSKLPRFVWLHIRFWSTLFVLATFQPFCCLCRIYRYSQWWWVILTLSINYSIWSCYTLGNWVFYLFSYPQNDEVVTEIKPGTRSDHRDKPASAPLTDKDGKERERSRDSGKSADREREGSRRRDSPDRRARSDRAERSERSERSEERRVGEECRSRWSP